MKPEVVASVTREVDLRKLKGNGNLEEDSVRHEVEFLRQCVDYHLVEVASHPGWHLPQHHPVRYTLVEVQDSTHRVDRDVVEGLRLT